jgi:DNA mismatch repair protein MutL
MPDVIKLLPDSVANQIAAGEVIQRPASLIKELVENSVDSGAGTIKIYITDAGRTLVQVIDDGSGMSETDARLSFERHATSKIRSAEDLFSIYTKGFRGEALASIASVSMVEIKTRKAEEETGTLIIINGSKVEKQEPVSCASGTNITVRNLFYNIPARRKFLKSDNTELRHIIYEFERIAIAHPSVKFLLTHNDKELFNLPVSNHRQRLMGLFGKNLNQALVKIETETSLIALKGYIGKPEFARKTYGEQFFFVNNRFLRHPYFHKAVMEAYENILPPDSLPSYFIFMTVDPSSIDVNIHPTKTEIKFENERVIWQIIHASVREAIGKFNISPSIDFDNEGLIDIPIPGKEFIHTPEIGLTPGYNPFSGDDKYERPNLSFDQHMKPEVGNWQKLYSGLSSEKESDQGAVDFNSAPGENEDSRSGRFMQIKQKYIICQVKSGIMMIDQKRAHERILYEKFLSLLENNTPASQKLLFPSSVELAQPDVELISEIEEDIKNIGFEVSYLGNNTISIIGSPADSMNDDPVEMLEILLEEYKSTGNDASVGPRERLARSMARASAIPYGRALTREEMNELFDMLFACSSPNWSPSGKPTVNILTVEELDKRMK